MYSGLKIREPLNGFLSVPLRGKCAVCKSKIHHPKSLVLNGAFGDNEGRGDKRRDLRNKGGPASPVAGQSDGVWGYSNLAPCGQAAASGRSARLPRCSPCFPAWALARAAPHRRADSCPQAKHTTGDLRHCRMHGDSLANRYIAAFSP